MSASPAPPKPPAAREPEGRADGQRGGGSKPPRSEGLEAESPAPADAVASLKAGDKAGGAERGLSGRWAGWKPPEGALTKTNTGRLLKRWPSGARGACTDPSGQRFKGWPFRRPRGTRPKNNEQHQQRPSFEHRTIGAGLHESELSRYGNRCCLDH